MYLSKDEVPAPTKTYFWSIKEGESIVRLIPIESKGTIRSLKYLRISLTI